MEPNSDEFDAAVEAAVAKQVVEQVAGLKTTNKNLKDEKEASRRKLAAFDGLDVDKYNAMIAEADEREKQTAQKKGDFDRLEEKLQSQHAKELKVRDARSATLTAALHKAMIEQTAVEAIATAGGRARSLKPHVVGAMSLREDDKGGFRTVFLDDNGEPMLSAEAKTASDFMTADEFVESLKADPDFMPLFDGTGAGGGGASGSAEGSRSGSKTVSSSAGPLALGKMADKIASGEVEVS